MYFTDLTTWYDGMYILLQKSAQDGRKGGKLQQSCYKIAEFFGKGVHKLINPKSGCRLKDGVNICRLKIYHGPQSEEHVAKHLYTPSKSTQRRIRQMFCLYHYKNFNVRKFTILRQ